MSDVNNDVVGEIWPVDMKVSVPDGDIENPLETVGVNNEPQVVEKPEDKPTEDAPAVPEAEIPATEIPEVETETVVEPKAEEVPEKVEKPTDDTGGEGNSKEGEETQVETTEPEETQEEPKPVILSGPLYDHLKETLKIQGDEIPEDFQAQSVNYVKSLEEYRDNNRKINAHLDKLIRSDPSYAEFTRQLIAGVPVEVALARNFDIENLKPVPGEENYEAYKQAVQDREARITEQQNFVSKLQSNRDASVAIMTDFAKEVKYSEDEGRVFFRELGDMLTNIEQGIIPKDLLQLIHLGRRYEKDIAKTAEQIRIEERNKKIKVMKDKNTVEAEPPSLQQTGVTPAPEPKINDDDWVTPTVNRFNR
jgi:hypothetical protein